MTDLSFNIGRNFSRFYQSMAEKIHQLAGPLNDDQLWTKPYPYGNSIGHLLLHLTGNLNYYIGAQIANTGYVRNRDLEFTDPSRKPKQVVLKAFDDVMAIVQSTLAAQSAADWGAVYTAKGMEDAGDRFTIFLRCAAHLDHHIAQIMYLAKELERSKAAGQH